MKAACLLTDSIYALTVSDRGGTGRDVLDPGFAGAGEIGGEDRMVGARSAGRGEASETSIGTVVGVSGVDVGTRRVLALPGVPFLLQ